MHQALLAELEAQDARLAGRGLAIWIGAEPTFTDPASQEPWWLGVAEGGDKLARAKDLARALARRLGGRATLSRLEGRLFPGEAEARFCLGVRLLPVHVPEKPGPGPGAGPGAGAGAGTLDDAGLEGPPQPVPALAPGEHLFTVTPDPGVIEVNMAPAPDLATFHAWCESVHAAASEVGLSAQRYRWNGQVTDSGGGGQITLGGPSAEESPFFRHPALLPRLVRYLSNHPALSYAFAGECLGSASQGPRPDEGVRERFEELAVAVDRLEARGDHLTRAELWATLAPLLVDASGNSHRAELNVEKLWNPWLGPRGKLGVVELRSLRMQPDARRQAAVAWLLRAVAARLALAPYREPLADWGGALHDRFALPAVLGEDLRAVLSDLEAHGLGPGPAVRALLLEPPAPVARVQLGGATLTLTPALEFWPLFGDVASQERSTARVVDSSAQRLELAVEHPRGVDPGRLDAAGWAVPLRPAGEGRHLAAVRWRSFAPHPGLHPGLPAMDPLVLRWERGGERLAIELHGWIPGGGVYPGLPADAAEAARRRAERVRVLRAPPEASGGPGRPLPAGPPPGRRGPSPAGAVREPPPSPGFTLDLRRLDALREAALPAHAGTAP